MTKAKFAYAIAACAIAAMSTPVLAHRSADRVPANTSQARGTSEASVPARGPGNGRAVGHEFARGVGHELGRGRGHQAYDSPG